MFVMKNDVERERGREEREPKIGLCPNVWKKEKKEKERKEKERKREERKREERKRKERVNRREVQKYEF